MEDRERIIPVDIESEMKKSYIDYSMSVIVARALPDVRDGFKPVHRRILYGMEGLGNTHNKPYKKSARIVGEVLGKYHPHGDSSVYGALVRMAQEWNMRYTLIDGQGNFGSVDGDGAAAMRYTEARLSRMGEEMMQDLEKETVDMTNNFDDTLQEPTVMPTRIPNLLVNGATGIAVGMATNIPTHNLGEVIDASVAFVDNPEMDSAALMDYIKGPDFPTGAYIMGIQGIKDAYETGRGRIIIRAKADIEVGEQHDKIVITEIPYGVNKAQLIEYIADLVKELATAEDDDDARREHEHEKPHKRLPRLRDERAEIAVFRGRAPSAAQVDAEVFGDPAADHAVIGRDDDGHDRREAADEGEPLVQRAECGDRGLAGLSADRDFRGHQREAEREGQDHVDEQEDASAVLRGEIGEAPQIAQADRGTCRRQDESELPGE